MQALRLDGINGQHLWGFLTATGSLSLLDNHAVRGAAEPPRLNFEDDGTAVLHASVAAGELPGVLFTQLQALRPFLDESLESVNKPTDFTRASYADIALRSTPEMADLLAGLACVVGEEAFESTLCAANGASHQNLVQSMRDILKLVQKDDLQQALFEPWRKAYVVPDDKRRQFGLGTRKPTLRLDPSDERLYALRFANPTTADDFRTEIGAQALAIPAFALLPVVPTRRRSPSHPHGIASGSRSRGGSGTSRRRSAQHAHSCGKGLGNPETNENGVSSRRSALIASPGRKESCLSRHHKAFGK